ncbi:hypothetical protein E2I00_012605, partial [Balaenoptera physalus]
SGAEFTTPSPVHPQNSSILHTEQKSLFLASSTGLGTAGAGPVYSSLCPDIYTSASNRAPHLLLTKDKQIKSQVSEVMQIPCQPREALKHLGNQQGHDVTQRNAWLAGNCGHAPTLCKAAVHHLDPGTRQWCGQYRDTSSYFYRMNPDTSLGLPQREIMHMKTEEEVFRKRKELEQRHGDKIPRKWKLRVMLNDLNPPAGAELVDPVSLQEPPGLLLSILELDCCGFESLESVKALDPYSAPVTAEGTNSAKMPHPSDVSSSCFAFLFMALTMLHDDVFICLQSGPGMVTSEPVPVMTTADDAILQGRIIGSERLAVQPDFLSQIQFLFQFLSTCYLLPSLYLHFCVFFHGAQAMLLLQEVSSNYLLATDYITGLYRQIDAKQHWESRETHHPNQLAMGSPKLRGHIIHTRCNLHRQPELKLETSATRAHVHSAQRRQGRCPVSHGSAPTRRGRADVSRFPESLKIGGRQVEKGSVGVTGRLHCDRGWEKGEVAFYMSVHEVEPVQECAVGNVKIKTKALYALPFQGQNEREKKMLACIQHTDDELMIPSVQAGQRVSVGERGSDFCEQLTAFLSSKMMLQHPGQVSASEVSASAIVPCLSPPGSLVFEDFANLTPFVKEELRFAIQSKHLCHRMSSALESVAPEEDERKKRRRERNKIAAAKCRNKKKEKTECLQKESEKLESVNAELKAQIEELKNEKQHLIYMLNLHRPTCIVRAQNGRTPEDERNLFIQQIKEGTLQS